MNNKRNCKIARPRINIANIPPKQSKGQKICGIQMKESKKRARQQYGIARGDGTGIILLDIAPEKQLLTKCGCDGKNEGNKKKIPERNAPAQAL